MRQAGRYLPEYRQVRERHGFWEMVKNPELAAEVTLQPVRRYGMDAAIVFSDILIVLDAMGVPIKFDGGGPELGFHVRTAGDLERLPAPDAARSFSYIRDAVSSLCDKLHPETAVIGFAGAPFTLAAYLVDGGPSKDVSKLKVMARREPELYDAIAKRISHAVIELLRLQIDAGADLVQIFDTWAGHLSPDDYRALALPYTRMIADGLRDTGKPVIVYVRSAASHLEAAADSGCDAVSVDFSIRLSEAVQRLGGRCAIQGNHDPTLLFSPAEKIREAVRAGISDAGDAYIVNLGQGLIPETPIEGVAAFVDAVKGRG
jgi:uroporphyrinogen decarboxylase